MADRVVFQPIRAGRVIAPDFTKAGAVFSAALNKIGQAGESFQTGKRDVAIDDFNNSVRNANTLEALDNIDTQPLIDRNASADQLAQAETNLKNQQLNIFQQQVNTEFDAKLDTNLAAMQDIIQKDPTLASTISIENGNPVFGKNPNKLKAAEQTNKNKFLTELKISPFNPVKSFQENNAAIRKQILSFNGSETDILNAQNQAQAHRDSLKRLSPGQQTQLTGLDQAVDFQLETNINQIEAGRDALAIRYGYTEEQAVDLLTTNETDLFAFIDKNGGEEFNFLNPFQMFEKAGMDIKEFTRDIIEDQPGVRPWMILNALKETLDVTEEDEQVNTSDFEKAVQRLADDTELHRNLDNATRISDDINLAKITATREAAIRKTGNLGTVRRAAGIRDTARNASLYNARLQAVQQSSVPAPIANSTTTPVPTPVDNTLNTGFENLTVQQALDMTRNTLSSLTTEDFDSIVNKDAVEILQNRIASTFGRVDILPEDQDTAPASTEAAVRNLVNSVQAEGTSRETQRAEQIATSNAVKQLAEETLKANTPNINRGTINRNVGISEAFSRSLSLDSGVLPGLTAEELLAEDEDPRITEIYTEIEQILDTREGSTTPLTKKNEIKILDLNLELLKLLGGTSEEIKRETEKANELKIRINARSR